MTRFRLDSEELCTMKSSFLLQLWPTASLNARSSLLGRNYFAIIYPALHCSPQASFIFWKLTVHVQYCSDSTDLEYFSEYLVWQRKLIVREKQKTKILQLQRQTQARKFPTSVDCTVSQNNFKIFRIQKYLKATKVNSLSHVTIFHKGNPAYEIHSHKKIARSKVAPSLRTVYPMRFCFVTREKFAKHSKQGFRCHTHLNHLQKPVPCMDPLHLIWKKASWNSQQCAVWAKGRVALRYSPRVIFIYLAIKHNIVIKFGPTVLNYAKCPGYSTWEGRQIFRSVRYGTQFLLPVFVLQFFFSRLKRLNGKQ